MKKKSIKVLVAFILAIVMAASPCIVIADNQWSKAENEYGYVVFNMINESMACTLLFYEVVKTNDINSLLIVAVALQETLTPHIYLKNPSQRFSKLYEYMDNAVIYSQNVTISLNSAIRQGDPKFLVTANDNMNKLGESLVNAMNEIKKMTAENEKPASVTSTTPSTPSIPKVGDPLGDVLYSDIIAYINGQAIPTSIKNGTTMVVVEDLANYGFDVKWDGKAKTLKVELNKNKKFTPLKVVKSTKPVGTFKCKYLYTDIKTYISGKLIDSFAIDGVTLIDFELLVEYGTLSWDGKTREIKLTIK
jgi:hypothetical protein